MKTSEQLINISKALIQVQIELPTIKKNCQGYGYKYASLDDVLNASKPILNKNGCCIIQGVGYIQNGISITTRILHLSGEYIEDTLGLPLTEMKGVNNTQAMGASITYGKRYGLSAILGISTDEDIDASTQNNTKQYANNSKAF